MKFRCRGGSWAGEGWWGRNYLVGRSPQDLGSGSPGQTLHVDHAGDAGLDRGSEVELALHGAGRAGRVTNLIKLRMQREGDVVVQRLELRVGQCLTLLSRVPAK